MASPTTQKPKTPPKYGKPEPRNWTTTLLLWGLILAAVGGITMMIVTNPAQKQLNCSRGGGQTSLIGFGSCTED